MWIWETNLGTSFPTAKWTAALRYLSKVSHLLTHWVQYLHLLHKWHLTLHRLSQLYPAPAVSPLCWCNCGQEGTLAHTFWYCPMLRPFWRVVSEIIISMTGRKFTLTPELALLHIGITTLASSLRVVLIHLLLIFTLLIVKRWRQPLTPKAEETIPELNLHCVMERAMATKKIVCKDVSGNSEECGWYINNVQYWSNWGIDPGTAYSMSVRKSGKRGFLFSFIFWFHFKVYCLVIG